MFALNRGMLHLPTGSTMLLFRIAAAHYQPTNWHVERGQEELSTYFNVINLYHLHFTMSSNNCSSSVWCKASLCIVPPLCWWRCNEMLALNSHSFAFAFSQTNATQALASHCELAFSEMGMISTDNKLCYSVTHCLSSWGEPEFTAA